MDSWADTPSESDLPPSRSFTRVTRTLSAAHDARDARDALALLGGALVPEPVEQRRRVGGEAEARRKLLEVGLGRGRHLVATRLVGSRVLGRGGGRNAQEEQDQNAETSQGNLAGTALLKVTLPGAGSSVLQGAEPTATPHGTFPAGMVFTTVNVARSMTLTSFDGPFAL